MESGARFVMTLGKVLMLEWSALSWDTRDKVCYIRSFQGDQALLMQLHYYYPGSVARRGAYYGSSSYGPISIGNTQCSGSETRLQDCGLSQTPGSACTHSQDAGVTCVGKRLIQIFHG